MIPIPEEIATIDFIKPVVLTVHQQMINRIFDQGKDANGNLIGEYSEGYIKQREKKGLGSSAKVVLEFTGQMRNDFVVLETSNRIGSGFTNQANADKSFFVEDTYNKEIFKLTQKEEQLFESLLQNKIDRELDGS